MNNNNIVIIAARRTPVGAFQGQFASLAAPTLGSKVIQAVMSDAAIDPLTVNEVIMGCVLQAGLGQAPARQAARAAGLPDSVTSNTINKVCASGMKAVMLGHDQIRAGSFDTIIAGGMESMTNAPFLLTDMRKGYRFGHQQTLDHMIFDGLQNVDDGELMGFFAEQCADRYHFTRQAQDDYARSSVTRTHAAMQSGAFDDEICAVNVSDKQGVKRITVDEPPQRCKLEKISTLKPEFRTDGGTVTAASSAAIADGAAALLLTGADTAAQQDWQPMARIIAHASYAQAPAEFTTSPIGAIRQLYKKTGWRDADIDLYEINEAFAVVVMAAMQVLHLDHERVNVNGGSCALGHPIGSTGARLLVSLIHALRKRQLRRGIAALCIGGGEATAMAVELM